MNKLKKIIIPIIAMFISLHMLNNFQFEVNASSANQIPNITIETSGDNKGNITGGLYSSTKKEKLLNKILKEYRGVITFISGIGMLSMIMFFIFNFIALGNSKGNPQERQKAITGLIVSGIATAGLGSVTLITTLFYNMINTSV